MFVLMPTLPRCLARPDRAAGSQRPAGRRLFWLRTGSAEDVGHDRRIAAAIQRGEVDGKDARNLLCELNGVARGDTLPGLHCAEGKGGGQTLPDLRHDQVRSRKVGESTLTCMRDFEEHRHIRNDLHGHIGQAIGLQARLQVLHHFVVA